MKQCVDVFEVISPNQRAMVVFSRGSKFEFDIKGNGKTGNWKIDPKNLEKVETVVVYLRKPNETCGRVFIGNYTGCLPSEETGRHIITFSGLEEICQTESNWFQFAKTGPGPIRYIN